MSPYLCSKKLLTLSPGPFELMASFPLPPVALNLAFRHLCCYTELRVLGEPGEGSPPVHRVTGSDSHLVEHTKQQHQKLVTEANVGG